jgi:hypothetical protein
MVPKSAMQQVLATIIQYICFRNGLPIAQRLIPHEFPWFNLNERVSPGEIRGRNNTHQVSGQKT